MNIAVLRNKTPEQVTQELSGFSEDYVRDWEQWLGGYEHDRISLFAAILRRWQATRPRPMRRLKRDATHDAPYMDDLLDVADSHLLVVDHIDVGEFRGLTDAQVEALRGLWSIFSSLPIEGSASCVGISKAVMLLTLGRIGPAFDSVVRKNLALKRNLRSSNEWIDALRAVGEDINAFEDRHDTKLALVVPERFATYQVGRLYDMVLGPRRGKSGATGADAPKQRPEAAPRLAPVTGNVLKIDASDRDGV